MSTRSAVGAATAPGEAFRGRYVHWDGYPGYVGKTLIEMVRRDGVETVLDVLTRQHYGWSSLGTGPQGLGPGYTDGRFEAVDGFGIAYTEVDGQTSPDEWVTTEEDWDTEYWYQLLPDGLLISLPGGRAGFLVDYADVHFTDRLDEASEWLGQMAEASA